MPFLATTHLPIPTSDVLTWCWNNRHAYSQTAPLYVDCATGTSLSAAQCWVLIRRLIAGFKHLGLRKGDVVNIHSFNSIYYPVLALGALGAGGVFVGTNPSYTRGELEHALRKTGAKFVITEKDLLAAIEGPARDRGIEAGRILVLGEVNEAQSVANGRYASWRSLLEHGEQGWEGFDDAELSSRTDLMYGFSSGTTGLPKAARISHANIIAQHIINYANPADQPKDYTVARLACLPFFHLSTAPYVFATALHSGYPAYIMRRFDLHGYLRYIKQYKATQLVLVPPMVTAIVNLARSSPQNAEMVKRSLKSVRTAIAGAAPLDREMQSRMQALFPAATPLTQVFGITEGTCTVSGMGLSGFDSTGSVGRPLPNLDVKLVNDDGEEVGYDTSAEACIRGPSVVREYLDAPDANAASWDSEGFYHTGDVVVWEKGSGLLYVVDRKKELIKVRGFQVAPAEVEGILLACPGVRDAAVIGIPDERSGEVPRAFVVRREEGEEGKALKEEVVVNWVDERLAKYKRLEGGVRFVATIPKNASGKILKRELREMAKKEVAAKL